MVDKSPIADDTTPGSATPAAAVSDSTTEKPSGIPAAATVDSPAGSDGKDASDVKPKGSVGSKPSNASKSNPSSPPAATTTEAAAPSSSVPAPPANPPAGETASKASSPGTSAPNPTVQFSRAVRPTFPGFGERIRSKLDSEPNPFEQSFSTSKSSYGASSVASRRSPPDLSSDRLSPFAYNDSSSAPQPVLPGVTQITTPLGDDDPFKWSINTPAISSIRGDPISPSGLPKSQTTPASSVLVSHALNFDPSNFVRTGLTPGTGMTPMSGGPTSFPPPSPGTAAFLAMVTNATAGAANTMAGSQSNEENSVMTPGTFNGMMNHLNSLSNQQQQSQQPQQQQSQQQQQQQHHQHQQFPSSNDGTQHSSQPSRPLAPPASKDSSSDYFSHRPSTDSKTHVQQVIQNDQAAAKNSINAAASATSGAPPAAHAESNGSNPPQFPPHPNQSYQGAPSHMADTNHPAGPGGHPSYHQAPPGSAPMPHHNGGVASADHYLQQGQAAASQAANGLFLLSQAHQAISRKEQDDRSYVGSGPGGPYPGQSYASAHQLSPPGPTSGKGKGKRKQTAPTDGQSPPPNKKGAANKARAKKAMSEESDDYAQIDSMMDESTSPVSSSGKNGKPETEEEKRKNFLERNRQAALKCRQRKKAWLGQLQQKVEYLELENGQLTNTISSLREEVNRLQSVLSKSGLLPGSGPMNPGHPNMYNQLHPPPHHLQQHQQSHHLSQPIHSHPGAHPQHHMQAGPPVPHQAFNGSNPAMNQLPPPPSGGPPGSSSGPNSQPGSISGPSISAQSSPLGPSRPISQVPLGPGLPQSHLHSQRGLGAFQQTATAGNY